MAEKTNQRSLKDLLENVYEVHRKDIKTFTTGHLNPRKLLTPEQKRHTKWQASDKPPVRLKSLSQSINLPVRKGELTRREKLERNSYDTMLEFSLGPVGTAEVVPSFKTTGTEMSDDKPTTRTITPRHGMEKIAVFQNAHIEELKLPEIMLPVTTAPTRKGMHCRTKSENIPRQQFINTYLAHPTKTEQFVSFREFGNQVLNLGDANDRGVLTGTKYIRNLERRLEKQLAASESAGHKGPNFRRLQLYSRCFEELISESETFGPLLQEIKDAYDSYVACLLDSQKPEQHRVLYRHMETVSHDQNISEQLRKAQERVKDLEKKAKQVLQENERLRRIKKEEEEVTQVIPSGSSDDRQKTVVHVEEIPKDLEEQVEDLHTQILSQLDTIDEIKRYQKEEYIPVTVCHHLEQCIKETEVDIQKLLKQNEFLEQSIQELEEELGGLLMQSGTSEKKARKLWRKVNMMSVIELGKKLAEEKRKTYEDL